MPVAFAYVHVTPYGFAVVHPLYSVQELYLKYVNGFTFVKATTRLQYMQIRSAFGQ